MSGQERWEHRQVRVRIDRGPSSSWKTDLVDDEGRARTWDLALHWLGTDGFELVTMVPVPADSAAERGAFLAVFKRRHST